MATGDLIKLGGLYLGGTLQPRPTRPWQNNVVPPGASEVGNIPNFIPGKTVEIRDTPSVEASQMQWVEVNHNGKKLLIADRVVLNLASWEDLNAQNLIFGKEITIGDTRYKVRSLTGGNIHRSGTNPNLGGSPVANEWDQYVKNELGLIGLPTPTPLDLNGSREEQDLIGPHNQKWNWLNANSWAQETHTSNSGYRATRGYGSSGDWGHAESWARDVRIGWRPVLEQIGLANEKMEILQDLTSATRQTEGRPWTVTVEQNIDKKVYLIVRLTNSRLSPNWIYNGTADGYYFGDVRAVLEDNIYLRTTQGEFYNSSNLLETFYETRIEITSSMVGKKISRITNNYTSAAYGDCFRMGVRIANDGGGTETRVWLQAPLTIPTAWFNATPTISLSAPTTNQILYENDMFNIAGTVSDTDVGNSVTVRYQINANTVRAIKAFVSDGTTLEAFSKQLRFSGGSLYDGDTLIASNLTDGVAHKLKVWATDDQGSTSPIIERDFYVVPNRAPSLTVDTPVIAGNIDSDKFTISGTYNDADGNTTTVKYRVNGGNSVQVASGTNGVFDFELSLGQLVEGLNTIVVEAIDSYGAKTSKTVKLNKNVVETAQLKSTARYKIVPPTKTVTAVLLWIERDKNLDIDVSISMTMVGESESFVPLTVTESVPIAAGSTTYEDTFFYEAASAKDNIIVQIDMARLSVDADDKITLISGVLE